MSIRSASADPIHGDPHSRQQGQQYHCPGVLLGNATTGTTRFRRSADEFCRPPISPDSVLSRSLSVDSSKALLLSFAGSRHQQQLQHQNQNQNHHQQRKTANGGKPSRTYPLSLNSSPMLYRPSPGPASGWSGFEDEGMRPPPWLGNCGRSSRKILHKYLCFLRPIYLKVRRMNWGGGAVHTTGPTTTAPGRKRAAGTDGPPSGGGCRRVFDAGMEKSIHEAVLHCKKSIGIKEEQAP